MNKAEIETEYRRLGYRSGWSFLGTPERTLRTARVGFVGLNPGGGGPNDSYQYAGLWDVPSGNAYLDERWGPNETYSPIQLQVQRWQRLLDLNEQDLFCAHFIPFRSPDWGTLERKKDAIAFASKLWSWVLEVSPASLFVTMGKTPAYHLAGLLGAAKVAQLQTGWGRQTIDVWDTPAGRRLVAMPHPSRFTLLNRSNGASDLAEQSFRIATS
jgi:hypothetical protein